MGLLLYQVFDFTGAVGRSTYSRLLQVSDYPPHQGRADINNLIIKVWVEQSLAGRGAARKVAICIIQGLAGRVRARGVVAARGGGDLVLGNICVRIGYRS